MWHKDTECGFNCLKENNNNKQKLYSHILNFPIITQQEAKYISDPETL